MKRPLINEITRLITRKVPDSFTAKQVEFTMAWAKLKREIGRELEPSVNRLNKWLVRFEKWIKNSD